MTRVDLLVAEVVFVLEDGLAEVVRPHAGRGGAAPAQQPVPQPAWPRRAVVGPPGRAVVRAGRAMVGAAEAVVRAGLVAVGMHVLKVRRREGVNANHDSSGQLLPAASCTWRPLRPRPAPRASPARPRLPPRAPSPNIDLQVALKMTTSPYFPPHPPHPPLPTRPTHAAGTSAGKKNNKKK